MTLFSHKPEAGAGLLEAYAVVYKGGLPEHAKSKAGKIDFKVFADRFEFRPTLGTKGWFEGLAIPYSRVANFQVVDRTVGTLEGILGGLDSRQLNQANNIHITFQDEDDNELVLRLEMISGITVMGAAKKCLELLDRLKVHKIREQFRPGQSMPSMGAALQLDIPDQIAKLAALRDQGILTAGEFNSKKAELLSKM